METDNEKNEPNLLDDDPIFSASTSQEIYSEKRRVSTTTSAKRTREKRPEARRSTTVRQSRRGGRPRSREAEKAETEIGQTTENNDDR